MLPRRGRAVPASSWQAHACLSLNVTPPSDEAGEGAVPLFGNGRDGTLIHRSCACGAEQTATIVVAHKMSTSEPQMK